MGCAFLKPTKVTWVFFALQCLYFFPHVIFMMLKFRMPDTFFYYILYPVHVVFAISLLFIVKLFNFLELNVGSFPYPDSFGTPELNPLGWLLVILFYTTSFYLLACLISFLGPKAKNSKMKSSFPTFFSPTWRIVVLTLLLLAPLLLIPLSFCDGKTTGFGWWVEILYVAMPLSVYDHWLHIPFVHGYNWFETDTFSYIFAIVMDFVLAYVFVCFVRWVIISLRR